MKWLLILNLLTQGFGGELCSKALSPYETYMSIGDEKFDYDPDQLERISRANLYKYQVYFENGLAYNYKKKLISTSNWYGRRTTAIYVMDNAGDIYISVWRRYGYFHHTSFGIDKVAAAGEIRIVRGVVTYIDNRSGHYTPPSASVYQTLEALRNYGVRTDTINLFDQRTKTQLKEESTYDIPRVLQREKEI